MVAASQHKLFYLLWCGYAAVPRRGREGEVFTARNRIPRDGAQVVFLKNDARDSGEWNSQGFVLSDSSQDVRGGMRP